MFIIRKHLTLTLPYNPTYFFSKSKKQKTLYQMLQVPTNATPTTIKKNYLKLAKIYHPDVYKGADKNRFMNIQQAYKILSNQNQRSRYDQTIGLKNKNDADTFQTAKEHKGQSGQVYGKPANDFTYSKPKVQINIDEQYEKFFKKKSTTNFQEIRLHEPTQFKAMSEKQRIRRRFTQVYTDANLDWKMKYSKSYTQTLDDQIKQKNTYQDQLKAKQKAYQQKYNQQGIDKRLKYMKAAAIIAFIFMMPFILSFRTKLQLEKQAKVNYEKKVQEIFQEMQTSDVKERLRFD